MTERRPTRPDPRPSDLGRFAWHPEPELLKEKRVILREMAMNNDDPSRRANRTLWATAFTTHPYRFPVIGYPDIYNRLKRDDVVAYYKEHYVPNNIVFVVVGDVDAAKVEQELRDQTKDANMGAVAPAFVPPEPPQLSLRERHEEMPTQLSQITLQVGCYIAQHNSGVMNNIVDAKLKAISGQAEVACSVHIAQIAGPVV